MTGRLWRHGLCIMPQMIAGVGGPSEIRPLRHLDAATTRGATMQPRSSFAHEELDDRHGPDGGGLEAADEVLPDPVVSDVESSPKYRRLFGDLPLHRAVLEVYCRMAALGGCLMGSNMADTVRMSDLPMRALADEARTFIIDYVDLLFGPAHTTKAHRISNHFLAALLAHGNLWEGDTSENEALHGPCRRMYARTNKRGPPIVLQMMRATETKAEVLRELREQENENAGGDDGIF